MVGITTCVCVYVRMCVDFWAVVSSWVVVLYTDISALWLAEKSKPNTVIGHVIVVPNLPRFERMPSEIAKRPNDKKSKVKIYLILTKNKLT